LADKASKERTHNEMMMLTTNIAGEGTTLGLSGLLKTGLECSTEPPQFLLALIMLPILAPRTQRFVDGKPVDTFRD
jgi:hypothetical protein